MENSVFCYLLKGSDERHPPPQKKKKKKNEECASPLGFALSSTFSLSRSHLNCSLRGLPGHLLIFSCFPGTFRCGPFQFPFNICIKRYIFLSVCRLNTTWRLLSFTPYRFASHESRYMYQPNKGKEGS